jgi:hypothetical protein
MDLRLGVPSITLVSALTTLGCFGHPLDPGEIAAEDMARASTSTGRERGAATVTCRCDGEGGLHVRAPEGSRVRVPDGPASDDAQVEVTLADNASTGPIRRTRSLGFIGDNKLTETRSRGGPWNAPDAVMPIHAHGGGSYGSGYGGRSGYGSGYGSRSYGRARPR